MSPDDLSTSKRAYTTEPRRRALEWLGCNPLAVDFFAGDFGPLDLRVLENRMVRARTHHECHGNGRPCEAGVDPGDEYRRQVEVSGADGLRVYRWCPHCLTEAIRECLPCDPG